MVAPKEYSRFLALSGLVAVVGVLLAMALVLLVDPYGIYRLIQVRGFNEIKPQPERYQKQIKLQNAQIVGAKAFILGNSRAELGFDPENPLLGENGTPAYNLALAGTGIGTSREQLENLGRTGITPARLIVGVDFLDFLVDPQSSPQPAPGIAPAALEPLKWQFDALFSMSSVADAVKTVRLQNNHDARTITARGFNPLLEYNGFARNEGYYSIFRQRATEYAVSFLKKPHGLVDRTGSSSDLKNLRAIMHSAARDGADLHLAIYPYHAQMLAMLEEVGLDIAMEKWKGILTQEVAAVRKEYPNAKIKLWDFSGFSNMQCEPIPAQGDKKSVTRWYWESGHFKAALGDLMLKRMLGKPQDAEGARFGMQLSEANLAANRQRFLTEREQCFAKHPELIGDARQLIRSARKRS